MEFSCHEYAMNAYKRLQKPDVVFGHAEWTAKVAFAEPLREPDPEVMAQVCRDSLLFFSSGISYFARRDHVLYA